MPRQQVATYDLMPEMSAPAITDVLCRAIEARSMISFCATTPTATWSGTPASLPATIKAVETVDACLARVLASAERAGAVTLITADHGNCELMIDPATGGPHTAHTTNPVPLVLIGDRATREMRRGGALCDMGPTILNLLGVAVPSEMTGHDLRFGAD